MKLYVDDTRLCPEGWALARTYEEALEILRAGLVTHLDLDWNLGQGRDLTGLTILKWLETAVRSREMPSPEISVHTADAGARRQMLELARRIDLAKVGRRMRDSGEDGPVCVHGRS